MAQPYEHPAFLQPDDQSIVLWRYLDAYKFKWLVNFSRLFMPNANQLADPRLGDPFEGTTPEGELKWWQDIAADTHCDEKRRIIENNRKFLSRMAKNFREKYYVSCWNANQYESHAMWRCYTCQPEAVAIRTKFETLRKCLPKYVEMGLVRYIDYYTERLPSMNMFEYITHKDLYYRFENEVRAVALHPPLEAFYSKHFSENHYELEASPGFLVYAPPVDITNLIDGVVLHPEASSTFQEEISLICMNKGLPKPDLSRKNRKPVF